MSDDPNYTVFKGQLYKVTDLQGYQRSSHSAKPHAVTSANGMSYAYDACGNMTTRGNQTLAYDEQNELVQVTTTNDTVNFGYDDAGERLWRNGTNGYSVWIGGIYEINNGKVLCHVFAGGKRLATFEPLCGGLWSKTMGEKNWYLASTKMNSIINWPFQKGRSQWTMFGGTWAAALGVCMMAGRKVRVKRYEFKRAMRRSWLWKQAVTLVSISAFLWASTPEVQAAPTYGPVFYYYHNDNLGSSNVLTDRTGQMVQHYEYATFGSSSFQDNTSAYQVSNRYTGQVCDDETGLYYYNARYYDAQLGRFIQPDTIVPSLDAPQTLNRYSYCDNNPLNFTDPSGHSFFGDIFKAIASVFTNVLTWVGVAIGFVIGGPVGGLIALGIMTGISVVSAAIANIAGPEAGMIAGCVLSIAFAAYGISQGVGMIGTNTPQGIATIVSSSLAIGSSSASLAGNSEVANDLGYASLAVAGVGAVDKMVDNQNTLGRALFGDKATVTGKFSNGKTFNKSFSTAKDFVDWLKTLPPDSITELKYVGHANPLALAFNGDNILETLTDRLGEHVDVIDGNGNSTEKDQVIRGSFAQNATIKFCACESAHGGMSSIAGAFKELLPNARVFGYTGTAIETWFGTMPQYFGLTGSHFVEVKP